MSKNFKLACSAFAAGATRLEALVRSKPRQAGAHEEQAADEPASRLFDLFGLGSAQGDLSSTTRQDGVHGAVSAEWESTGALNGPTRREPASGVGIANGPRIDTHVAPGRQSAVESLLAAQGQALRATSASVFGFEKSGDGESFPPSLSLLGTRVNVDALDSVKGTARPASAASLGLGQTRRSLADDLPFARLLRSALPQSSRSAPPTGGRLEARLQGAQRMLGKLHDGLDRMTARIDRLDVEARFL